MAPHILGYYILTLFSVEERYSFSPHFTEEARGEILNTYGEENVICGRIVGGRKCPKRGICWG